ncbi:MAG: hypothetical protein ABI549_10835 [Flavobacterium sp.]|uniref:hypothetical protein n=1 Tax=Flavobacterium sp. TaxID=239 RepID=UPI0032646517
MSQEIQIETHTEVKSYKYTKLLLSLVFDAIGMLSYAIPILAEFTDIVWAPISGFLLTKMYKGTTGKIAGILGFLEELLPETDIIPTFTLTWLYVYVIRNEK